MIPTVNEPTCVTRNTATAIDHIITNTVISGIQHRSGIIKTVISDHFCYYYLLLLLLLFHHIKEIQYKCYCLNSLKN